MTAENIVRRTNQGFVVVMSIPVQYQPVRIVKLLHPIESYDSWGVNSRPPEIGDIGILIDYQKRNGVIEKYVVEMTGPSGKPHWLCDFDAEEISAA